MLQYYSDMDHNCSTQWDLTWQAVFVHYLLSPSNAFKGDTFFWLKSSMESKHKYSQIMFPADYVEMGQTTASNITQN